LRYRNRGQVFGIDGILALTVTFLSLTVFFAIWNYGALTLYREQRNLTVEYNAHYLADLLVKMPGDPENWHKISVSDVRYGGIAVRRGVILREKIEKLISFPLSTQRRLLGAPFKFNVTVLWENNTPVAGAHGIYTLGACIEGNPSAISVYRLPVVMTSEQDDAREHVYLRVVVWR